jgi:hypothetical protein
MTLQGNQQPVGVCTTEATSDGPSHGGVARTERPARALLLGDVLDAGLGACLILLATGSATDADGADHVLVDADG